MKKNNTIILTVYINYFEYFFFDNYLIKISDDYFFVWSTAGNTISDIGEYVFEFDKENITSVCFYVALALFRYYL